MNNRRKEPCRNFQRGSCQYGDRCKFLHVTQQPSKPNSFGFGVLSTSQLPTNQQQQKPNFFGFGLQNVSQSKGASNFSAKYQNQPQPFVNKWTRSSSKTSQNSKPSEQTDTQPHVVVHKCTDPESCKRQIIDDLKQERPLWKLTCFGHSKSHPCDIVGDISYEELRASAYEDARRGLTLPSIVERERNLLNSKLIEFDNLLRNPYVISQNPSSTGPSLFPAINHNPFPPVQSNAPLSVSSFSQLGASANLVPSFSLRSPAPSSNAFAQPDPFQIPSQTSGGFEMKFGTSGLLSGQSPTLPFGTSPGQNIPNFRNGIMTTQSSPFSHPPVQSAEFPSSTTNHSPGFVDSHRVVGNTVGQPSVDAISLDNKQEINLEDCGIWLKEEWEIGEIPEEEPPGIFCL